MLTVQCAQCGKTFGAQRKTAKYCSTNCRVKATNARKAQGVIPMRRDGAQLHAVPPANPSADGFAAATERRLTEAGRLDTYQGVAAMFAARLLDSGGQDTMSSMAAMLREYKASMREALEGAAVAADPLDEILARRTSRSA